MEALEQARSSFREILTITVGDYRHADGRGSEQDDSIIFLLAVFGVKPGKKQISHLFQNRDFADELSIRRGANKQGIFQAI